MDKVYYCESIHFFWWRSATFCGKKTTRSLLREPVYVASDNIIYSLDKLVLSLDERPFASILNRCASLRIDYSIPFLSFFSAATEAHLLSHVKSF